MSSVLRPLDVRIPHNYNPRGDPTTTTHSSRMADQAATDNQILPFVEKPHGGMESNPVYVNDEQNTCAPYFMSFSPRQQNVRALKKYHRAQQQIF